MTLTLKVKISEHLSDISQAFPSIINWPRFVKATGAIMKVELGMLMKDGITVVPWILYLKVIGPLKGGSVQLIAMLV